MDNSQFHAVNFYRWKDIYSKITDRFADKTKSWKKGLHWANTNGYNTNQKIQYCYDSRDDWEWFHKLPEIILDYEKMVYLLIETRDEKFEIYEGFLPEVIVVLAENIIFSDYYIVSKKYEWIIGYNHHEIVSFVGKGLRADCLKK